LGSDRRGNRPKDAIGERKHDLGPGLSTKYTAKSLLAPSPQARPGSESRSKQLFRQLEGRLEDLLIVSQFHIDYSIRPAGRVA
jgi:hypothetical protein